MITMHWLLLDIHVRRSRERHSFFEYAFYFAYLAMHMKSWVKVINITIHIIRSRSSKWQDPTDFLPFALFYPFYSLINVKMGQPELNIKKIVAKTGHFCWLSSMNNIRHSQKTEFFSTMSKIHISKMPTDSQKTNIINNFEFALY